MLLKKEIDRKSAKCEEPISWKLLLLNNLYFSYTQAAFLFNCSTIFRRWNWVISFVLLVEMISYYLANRKVKESFSYCLNVSFVNLMTVAISFCWYYFQNFYLSTGMIFLLFPFRNAFWSYSSDKNDIKPVGNIVVFAGRQHWPGNDNQGNFLLPLWEVPWLCVRFHTAYSRWS
jgi:hypothetical protein